MSFDLWLLGTTIVFLFVFVFVVFFCHFCCSLSAVCSSLYDYVSLFLVSLLLGSSFVCFIFVFCFVFFLFFVFCCFLGEGGRICRNVCSFYLWCNFFFHNVWSIPIVLFRVIYNALNSSNSRVNKMLMFNAWIHKLLISVNV